MWQAKVIIGNYFVNLVVKMFNTSNSTASCSEHLLVMLIQDQELSNLIFGLAYLQTDLKTIYNLPLAHGHFWKQGFRQNKNSCETSALVPFQSLFEMSAVHLKQAWLESRQDQTGSSRGQSKKLLSRWTVSPQLYVRTGSHRNTHILLELITIDLMLSDTSISLYTVFHCC